MRPFILMLAMAAAVPAFAQASSAPLKALLQATEGIDPVQDTRGGLFLAGLGLTAAGLVLGGAGFGILYTCREGQSCHDDKTLNTVGWVLAAPGVIPLGLGLILLYAAMGGKGGSHGASAVAFSVAPLPGGGAMAGGLFRF